MKQSDFLSLNWLDLGKMFLIAFLESRLMAKEDFILCIANLIKLSNKKVI